MEVNNNHAIIYLIKNDTETILNLKNSLYFLYKNYLKYYPTKVIFFHEDLDISLKENIISKFTNQIKKFKS